MMRGDMENSPFTRCHRLPSLSRAAYGENRLAVGANFMIIRKFSSDIRGATAIEYGLIVALIALAIIGALRSLGGGTGGMWTFISGEVTGAINGAGAGGGGDESEGEGDDDA